MRDKKLVCFVCKSKVLWLSRHLEEQHLDNFMVAQVAGKVGLARKHGFKRLSNLGSFQHNVRVLKRGKGELIVARRTKVERSNDDYLPCNQCYGFYYKFDIWRHRCCNKASDDGSTEIRSKDVMDQSRSLLLGALQANSNRQSIDKHLDEQVLRYMRKDNILKVVRTDKLILQFGVAQLKRIGVKGQRRIASRMRLLARLLQTLRKIVDLPNKPLSYFLNSLHFDALLEAVESLCGLHLDSSGQRSFKTPSLALMIGNSLTKCVSIKKGMAIRLGDEDGVKEAERFQSLYTTDYSDSLSCPALATLKTQNYSKPVELPSTGDLVKLKEFTDRQISSLSDQLIQSPNYNCWRPLSEAVLARLVVFNKRRASEPAKLELSQYLNRPNWKKLSNQEVLKSLNPLEAKLMNRMDLIQVPGKRNRRVPILITPEVGKAMDLLAKTRYQCGISKHNQYFFATDSTNGYLNTWLVLHNHAVAAKVESPRLITSGRLRKYVATIAQVVSNFELIASNMHWFGLICACHDDLCWLSVDTRLELVN